MWGVQAKGGGRGGGGIRRKEIQHESKKNSHISPGAISLYVSVTDLGSEGRSFPER